MKEAIRHRQCEFYNFLVLLELLGQTFQHVSELDTVLATLYLYNRSEFDAERLLDYRDRLHTSFLLKDTALFERASLWRAIGEGIFDARGEHGVVILTVKAPLQPVHVLIKKRYDTVGKKIFQPSDYSWDAKLKE